MEINNKVVGIVGTAIVAGLGWAGYGVKKLADKVGMSINELNNADTQDIVKSVASEAVEKSADRILKSTADKIVQTSIGRLIRQTDKMVSEQETHVRDELERVLGDRVGKIDTDKLSEDIRQSVSNKMADEVLDNFKRIINPNANKSNDVSSIVSAIGELDSDWDKRMLLQSVIDKMKG